MRQTRTHDSIAPAVHPNRLRTGWPFPAATRWKFVALAAWIAFALVSATSLAPSTARAEILAVEVAPPEPFDCTPVDLILSGTLSSSCQEILRVRVGEPRPLDTMGPVPVYQTDVRVIVQDPDPRLMLPCTQALERYKVERRLGTLPAGIHLVEALEYVYPFPADSTAPRDSSRVSFRFTVRPDSCPTPPGCVLLGFAGSSFEPFRIDGCTARTAPGHRTCFDVTLQNSDRVGALQTEIRVLHRDPANDATDLFTPVAVLGTPRTEGFQVAWTAEGSMAKVLLYSTSGASIPPGRGPVLHVCYAVQEATPPGIYPIRFGRTIVSDPRGGQLFHCPTFAEVEGRICVGEPTPACDVNGDGVSNIRDIVRMVRCILAAAECPDSIQARADCNQDQTVDVRDIVCCVRRILAQEGGWGPDAPGGSGAGEPIRLGFEGPATWTSPLEARATLSVEPGSTFGGLQWILDPGNAARVRSVSLGDPDGDYALDWAPLSDGSIRVMLYRRGLAGGSGAGSGAGELQAARIPMTVVVEAMPGSNTGGSLSIRSALGATIDAAGAMTEIGAASAALPANSAPQAPAVLPARPNPFVQDTEISYFLPAAARVELRLFDVRGKLVRTLHSGPSGAGTQRVRWDGKNDGGQRVSAGIYVVRLTTAGAEMSQRILRLR